MSWCVNHGKGDHVLALWQTPVKEIVKGTVVICPAFCCEMTLVMDKKSWVFVVLLKFDYRKMVLLHERRKLPVKLVASRARNARVIVKVAGQRHAENQWSRVNSCQTTQE